MRFLIIVKATKACEDDAMPAEELIAEMATYHEKLSKAGVLLDSSGLHPSSKGWRIRYSGGKRAVTDGPLIETKELISGYTLIQVKSRRFPIRQGKERMGRSKFANSSNSTILDPVRPLNRFHEVGVGSK
jgi:hypothetical protein